MNVLLSSLHRSSKSSNRDAFLAIKIIPTNVTHYRDGRTDAPTPNGSCSGFELGQQRY
jgi:hypothetical protein